ncbi:hypothetical protein AB9P05_16195 [Roseivirga sp. BDSF3-8]|uniref:hypothetical protein n=1 Tax=Roseivirga sp. BDSF3-8 TaxID=3241598 RepID=UPI003531BD30
MAFKLIKLTTLKHFQPFLPFPIPDRVLLQNNKQLFLLNYYILFAQGQTNQRKSLEKKSLHLFLWEDIETIMRMGSVGFSLFESDKNQNVHHHHL